jgi:hypothetical protein
MQPALRLQLPVLRNLLRSYIRTPRRHFSEEAEPHNPKKTPLAQSQDSAGSLRTQISKKWDEADSQAQTRIQQTSQGKLAPETLIQTLDSSISIESSDLSNFIPDPRAANQTYITFDSKPILSARNKLFDQASNRIIRSDPNSLFSKFVQSGKIDITDPKVKIEAISLSETFLATQKPAQNIAQTGQINLGEINVLAKNEVSLQDVDLREIPANLDIVLNPSKKIAIAVGVETRNSTLNFFFFLL